jgi:CRISPR-associated endonuclease/helicase Cas3
VAQHHVSACTIPDGLAAAAVAARASWGRWERDSPRVLLALLQPNNDDTARYGLDGTDGKEQPVKVFYSGLRGLSWGEAWVALVSMHKKRFVFTYF